MRRPFLHLATLALGATAASAQIPANGFELQVNTFTTSVQKRPHVAADGVGNLVVVWQSNGSSGTDTDSYSIQAQRYDTSGNPSGAQFQVNTYTISYQSDPAVAMSAQGNFVVAWDSNGSPGTDTSQRSIQAQRFNSSGVPLGAQFQVNTYTTGDQDLPAVAMDGLGNFVVVWESFAGGVRTNIEARRYDASGAALGAEFQVNSYTTAFQFFPAIAMDSLGSFVVVWDGGSYGTDTSGSSIQAQRYANGTALGPQFQVNTYTTNGQSNPAVGMDSAGNFVVAWQSLGSDTDTDLGSIQAQRFAADGTPQGLQFQVNAYTTANQLGAAVGMDSAGNFVVAWESNGSNCGIFCFDDTSGYSIQARHYDGTGTASGQFQVNTYTSNDQRHAQVAFDGQGNFVIAWDSNGSSGTDTSGTSAHAQRYDQLFRDGFESGNAGRWSAIVP